MLFLLNTSHSNIIFKGFESNLTLIHNNMAAGRTLFAFSIQMPSIARLIINENLKLLKAFRISIVMYLYLFKNSLLAEASTKIHYVSFLKLQLYIELILSLFCSQLDGFFF